MKNLILLILLPFTLLSQSYNHADTLGDYNGYRYFASKERFSFWGAEQHIQSVDSNLHLLSIHSEDENLFVYDRINQLHYNDNTQPFYWLGGHDETEEGNWVWLDGSQWDYDDWETDTSQITNGPEPNNLGQNEHYLMGNYYLDGSWNDATNNSTDDPFYYVFKVEIIEVQDTVTQDTTSQDTTKVVDIQIENKIFPTYQRVELSKVVFETSWENETQFYLHDSGGRLVHNTFFNTEQRNVLELPLLSAGIYYGVMKNNGELFRFKILLTK